MTRLALLVLATGLFATSVVRADDALSLGGYDLGATLTAGYRSVDVDGSESKYREDYNLRSGVRLFLFDVDGVAHDTTTAPLDRFHLVVSTPGDEPTSTFHLSAADTDAWEVNANFVRSKYFYAVPALFENPVPGDVRTDDLHDFDQIRTNGSVDVRITRPNLPVVFAGYRLYRLEGDTVSTLAVPGGDTFSVRAPTDMRAHVGRIGTEFRTLGTDVYLVEEYRRVIRDVGGHGPLPGEAGGLDPTDASTLGRYDAVGSEHTDSPTTIVRLRRPVGDRLELTGSYLYSHSTLDSSWTTLERATSTGGAPVAKDGLQTGSATLSAHVADLAATYRLTDTARLHASYRYDERAESGNLDEQSLQAPFLAVGTGDHLKLHRVTVDAEVEPRRDLVLRAGLRYALRDANLSSGGVGPVSTTALGAIADVRYRPSSKVDGFLRYETAQIDDPYRSAGDPFGRPPVPGREVAFTLTNRGSAGLTVRPWSWARLAYRLVADSRENSTFGGRRFAVGNSAALTLTPIAGLTFTASYARRDVDNQADLLLAPRFVRVTSLQAGTEDVLISQLAYDFGLVGQRWTTGWNVNWASSDEHLRPRLETDGGARTRFALDRVDGGVYLTWRHAWVEPSIEVRVVDYAEPTLPRNDYRATIVTVSLTRRFGTAASVASDH